MSTTDIRLNDEIITIELGDSTILSSISANRAEAAAAVAQTSASALLPEAKLLLVGEAIEPDTVFVADRRLVNGNTFTRFHSRVIGGTGSLPVAVVVDGVLVFGPVTVDEDGVTETVEIEAPVNADIEFSLGAPITGAPTAVLVKIEGSAV